MPRGRTTTEDSNLTLNSQYCQFNSQPCPCISLTKSPANKVDELENYFSMAIDEDELLE